MGLRDIIGQEQAKEFLKSSIVAGRIANGYLFHGPRGVGKATLAVAFAQALNCENNDPDGCGECGTCRRIARFVHPDVTFIYPTTAKDRAEDIQATLKERSENPMFVQTFPEAASIKIKRIQDLRMDLAMGVREARRRVVILAFAEKMGPDASNCLLKMLEEPTPDDARVQSRVTFILTAPSRNSLLTTIVSRCQAVHFSPLPAVEIQRLLMQHGDRLKNRDGRDKGDKADKGEKRDKRDNGDKGDKGDKRDKGDKGPKAQLTEREAAILARLSGGSVSAAVEFAEQDIVKYRDKNLEFLRSLGGRTPAELLTKAEALADRNDRSQVEIFVRLGLLWLRDLLLLKCGGRESDLAYADLAGELRREAEGLELTEIRRRAEILEEVVSSMQSNVDMSLLLSASFLRLAGVVGAERPFTTRE